MSTTLTNLITFNSATQVLNSSLNQYDKIAVKSACIITRIFRAIFKVFTISAVCASIKTLVASQSGDISKLKLRDQAALVTNLEALHTKFSGKGNTSLEATIANVKKLFTPLDVKQAPPVLAPPVDVAAQKLNTEKDELRKEFGDAVEHVQGKLTKRALESTLENLKKNNEALLRREEEIGSPLVTGAVNTLLSTVGIHTRSGKNWRAFKSGKIAIKQNQSASVHEIMNKEQDSLFELNTLLANDPTMQRFAGHFGGISKVAKAITVVNGSSIKEAKADFKSERSPADERAYFTEVGLKASKIGKCSASKIEVERILDDHQFTVPTGMVDMAAWAAEVRSEQEETDGLADKIVSVFKRNGPPRLVSTFDVEKPIAPEITRKEKAKKFAEETKTAASEKYKEGKEKAKALWARIKR